MIHCKRPAPRLQRYHVSPQHPLCQLCDQRLTNFTADSIPETTQETSAPPDPVGHSETAVTENAQPSTEQVSPAVDPADNNTAIAAAPVTQDTALSTAAVRTLSVDNVRVNNLLNKSYSNKSKAELLYIL